MPYLYLSEVKSKAITKAGELPDGSIEKQAIAFTDPTKYETIENNGGKEICHYCTKFNPQTNNKKKKRTHFHCQISNCLQRIDTDQTKNHFLRFQNHIKTHEKQINGWIKTQMDCLFTNKLISADNFQNDDNSIIITDNNPEKVDSEILEKSKFLEREQHPEEDLSTQYVCCVCVLVFFVFGNAFFLYVSCVLIWDWHENKTHKKNKFMPCCANKHQNTTAVKK